MFSKYLGTVSYSHFGREVLIPDVTKHMYIPQEYKTDDSYWFKHTINDNDTLSSLARNLYGNSNYWIFITLLNDMVNIVEDWPIPYAIFDDWFRTVHYDKAFLDTHHYEDKNGVVHDPNAYVVLRELESIEEAIGRYDLKVVTMYDYYLKENEKKRVIKLLLPEFISGLVKQVEGVLR